MSKSDTSNGPSPLNEGWLCEEFGDYQNLSVKPIADGKPGAGQVLIKNQVFALGFPDLLMVQGKYQLKPSLPFVPGTEFCGTVIGAGGKVNKNLVGAKVVGSVRFGAAAKLVVANESDCIKLPSKYSFAEGAAFLVAYKTAYVGLVARGKLKCGEKVLVLGASGGVGLAAVNLAKHLGATVYGVVKGKNKLQPVLEKGADYVIDINKSDLRSEIKRMTENKGVDVVFDPVGGTLFKDSIRCLAPFGRMLVIGFASGTIPKLSINYALIKQLSIIGVRAGEYGRQNEEGGKRVMKELERLIEREKIKPAVYETLGWHELKRGFAFIENREVIGRVTIACE